MSSDTWLKDSVGSKNNIGHTPGGVMHTADSLMGGREGTVVLKFGSPGSPMSKAATKPSGYMGKTPKLFAKFQGKGQK